MKSLSTLFCAAILLWSTCREVSAQSYNSLYQYFEAADSTARPGYSSIKEKTIKTIALKHRTITEITTKESFYDEAGRLIREERTGSTGIETQLVFQYDSISNRINYIMQTDGNMKHEAFASYDERGRLAEIVYCRDDKPCQVQHYVYEDDNTEYLYRLRQEVAIQSDTKKKGRTLFGISVAEKQTDELIRERFFDPEGKLEEVRVYAGGKLTKGWLFGYDISGRVSNTWVFNGKDKKLAIESEYNEEGLLQTEKHFVWIDDCNITSYDEAIVVTYEYDNGKQLIRTENNKGTITEYVYSAW